MSKESFEWDVDKDIENQLKHGVSFEEAKYAFEDLNRLIAPDKTHSANEIRYYCIGKVDESILTVRFTYRGKRIRIYGAGHWRKGKKVYEKEN